jgi:hypothetical protein
MKTLLLSAALAFFSFQQIQPQQRLGKIGVLTAEQKQVLAHFSIVQIPDGQFGTVDALRLTGNLQIVNGTGSSATTNGTGNLVMGYNEFGGGPGSHNLILGKQASYFSHGGFVGGEGNTIAAPYASVVSGLSNNANATNSVCIGGVNNLASGNSSVAVGGTSNQAQGTGSVVSGGNVRTAVAADDWVAGTLFEDN